MYIVMTVVSSVKRFRKSVILARLVLKRMLKYSLGNQKNIRILIVTMHLNLSMYLDKFDGWPSKLSHQTAI